MHFIKLLSMTLQFGEWCEANTCIITGLLKKIINPDNYLSLNNTSCLGINTRITNA
jgi:hypothetical protein